MLGRKNDSGSRIEINGFATRITGNCAVFIGPESTGVKVDDYGKTYFKSSVYDKFNNEILGGGGGGGTWYEHGTDIFIGPGYGNTPSDNVDKLVLGKKDDVVKIELGSSNFAVKAGPDYNQREYINAGQSNNLYLHAGTSVYIGPNTSNEKAYEVNIDANNKFAVKIGYNYNQREYINAGSGNSLYLYGGSYVYIGPNTNNDKADNVVIDVKSSITLKVDDLTLELDKTKLQKLIDKLAE